ncbi:MAG: hypothetical protein QFB86_03700 [Patescibacteria group bacterium]|nr:hypothetical protein [Patescibacteria group bacterium]
MDPEELDELERLEIAARKDPLKAAEAASHFDDMDSTVLSSDIDAPEDVL